ncbi:MAG: DUF3179 domain-containing protein [Myxococcales bacterium]|nr:DUF3179 domain-containing protein [Myxococcales bacterium]
MPRDEILAGGPVRDAIRAVDAPGFASADDAKWVAPDTVVVGLALGGEARAYPVHLLEYHQVVNDVVAGTPVVVSYDPLAGAPVAFRAVVKEGEAPLRFGVSGLVFQSHALLFDRESESLWSPLRGEAIAGPRAGTAIARLRVRQEAFAVWRHRHPDTRVLERPDPERVDYRYSPFEAYWVSDTIPFPVAARDDRYHPKEVALGMEAGGVSRAYLGSVLTSAGGRVVDVIAGHRVHVAYDGAVGAFSWEAPEDVRVTDAYWFAWKAFHPDTGVWRPEGAASAPDDEGAAEGR